MSEMIERVANALEPYIDSQYSREAAARAVIKAMRRPPVARYGCGHERIEGQGDCVACYPDSPYLTHTNCQKQCP